MSSPQKKVLGAINPNPIITLTSETNTETILDIQSPFKSMTLHSATEDENFIPQRPKRIMLQFPTKSKAKSKSKSKIKSKIEYRPVPRHIQLAVAEEDGDLEVLGPKVEGGIPLPFTRLIKVEPEAGFDLPIVTNTEHIPPPPTTIPDIVVPKKESTSKMTESKPASKIADRPTPPVLRILVPQKKSKTAKLKASAKPKSKSNIRPSKLTISASAALQREATHRATLQREQETRRSQDPELTPNKPCPESEIFERILDPIVTERVYRVSIRLERCFQAGVRYWFERGYHMDRDNFFIPLHSHYPLDYTLDNNTVWIKYMKCGSREYEGKRGMAPANTPTGEHAERVLGVKVESIDREPMMSPDQQSALVADVRKPKPQQELPTIKDDPSSIVDVGLQAIDTGIEALSAFLADGGESKNGVSKQKISDLSDLVNSDH